MRKYRRLLFLMLFLLISAAMLFMVFDNDLYHISSLERTFLRLGTGAGLLFFFLCCIRTFALLPCGIFSAAAGMIFGPFTGTLLTLAGFIVNAWIVYALSACFGREWVKKLLKNKARYIDEFVSANSFSSFLFLRVVPLLPFDAVSCLAGVSNAKLLHYLLATAIGSIPGIAVYAYFGDSLKTLSLVKIAAPATVMIILSIIPFIINMEKYRKILRDSIDRNTKSSI